MKNWLNDESLNSNKPPGPRHRGKEKTTAVNGQRASPSFSSSPLSYRLVIMDNSRLPSISQLSLPPLQRQNALSANAPKWGHHSGNWGGYAGNFGHEFGAPGPFKENPHVYENVYENVQHRPQALPFPPYPTPNHHGHTLPPIPSDDDEHELPLPGNGDLAVVKAKALSNLKPTPRVGGVRVTKPKKKVRVVKNDNISKPGKGRPKGAAGFGADETNKILDLVETNQPIGQQGWDKVAAKYNEWAEAEGHKMRTAQSLDKKFKTLVNTKKPMGDGVKPAQISHTQEIDSTIRADNYISFVVSAVAQCAARPPRNQTRVSAPNLVQTLASTFDPGHQQQREEARDAHAFQAQQLFSMTQQLESLRNQLMVMHERVHRSEREQDMAHMELRWVRSERIPASKRKASDVFHGENDSDKENAEPALGSPFVSSSPSSGSLFVSTSSAFASSPAPEKV
ncbi:hypothetical protein GGX14DRAFT_560615 [Mycena pura]|uniref:DUF6818 domain-containing protein n=1 Tax=Mycena pura TaxID=153505 RepID=A0AAD6YGZ8_9AGAR|nr:hypothetical protein GGX14DRAFT_560615 [Mycena pura]